MPVEPECGAGPLHPVPFDERPPAGQEQVGVDGPAIEVVADLVVIPLGVEGGAGPEVAECVEGEVLSVGVAVLTERARRGGSTLGVRVDRVPEVDVELTPFTLRRGEGEEAVLTRTGHRGIRGVRGAVLVTAHGEGQVLRLAGRGSGGEGPDPA